MSKTVRTIPIGLQPVTELLLDLVHRHVRPGSVSVFLLSFHFSSHGEWSSHRHGLTSRVATTSTTTCTSVASTLTAQEEREARGSESVVVSQRHQIITIPRERARKAVEGDVTIPRERANPRPVSLFLRSNGVPVPAQNLEVTAQQQNTAASWNHLDSLLLRIKPPHRNAWLSHVSSNHENSSVASTHRNPKIPAPVHLFLDRCLSSKRGRGSSGLCGQLITP
jgi:hypothetical protein